MIVSVLEELRQRNGLQIALGGRYVFSFFRLCTSEGSDLENILSFFLKYISYPSYSLPICDCVAVVLDLYSPEGGRSSVLDDFISKLYKVIHQELQFEEDVYYSTALYSIGNVGDWHYGFFASLTTLGCFFYCLISRCFGCLYPFVLFITNT